MQVPRLHALDHMLDPPVESLRIVRTQVVGHLQGMVTRHDQLIPANDNIERVPDDDQVLVAAETGLERHQVR